MKAELMLKVKEALIEVLNLGKGTEILSSSKLKDNLGLDSMSSLTFLVTLEENIEGFEVDPETLQLSDLETVDSITQYVWLKIEHKTQASIPMHDVDNTFVKHAYA